MAGRKCPLKLFSLPCIFFQAFHNSHQTIVPMKQTCALAVILITVLSRLCLAQCDTTQTPNFVAVPEGGFDTIHAWQIRPGFGFEMHYDSGHTMYRVTDVKLNNAPLWLHGWCEGKTIRDLSPAALADSTRSDTFTVHTDDTIRFYRELAWFNPATLNQTPDGYYALDTLDYVVELIKASNGVRRALLDSTGILRRTTIGAPDIYGTQPIISIITYIVPALLNNEEVFIRMKPNARGNGSYDFVRTDRWALRLSERLGSSVWQQYILHMGG